MFGLIAWLITIRSVISHNSTNFISLRRISVESHVSLDQETYQKWSLVEFLQCGWHLCYADIDISIIYLSWDEIWLWRETQQIELHLWQSRFGDFWQNVPPNMVACDGDRVCWRPKGPRFVLPPKLQDLTHISIGRLSLPYIAMLQIHTSLFTPSLQCRAMGSPHR